jgi:hypothetical protein
MYVPAIDKVSPVPLKGNARFNMQNFLKIANNKAIVSGDTDAMLGFIDYLMTTFAEPGTLNKGVMFTGQLRELNRKLGVALVTMEDEDNRLTTTAKSVNQPTALMNIQELIAQTAIKPVPVIPKTETDDTAKKMEQDFNISRSSIEKGLAEINSLIDSATSLEAIQEPVKMRLQYIADQLSKEKHLYKPADLTIIEEKIASTRKKYDEKVKELLSTSTQEDEDEDVDIEAIEDLEVLFDKQISEIEKFIATNPQKDALVMLRPNIVGTIDMLESIQHATLARDIKIGFLERLKVIMNTIDAMIKVEMPAVDLMNSLSNLDRITLSDSEMKLLENAKTKLATATFTKKQIEGLGILNTLITTGSLDSIDVNERADARELAATTQLELKRPLKEAGMSDSDIQALFDIFRKSQSNLCSF